MPTTFLPWIQTFPGIAKKSRLTEPVRSVLLILNFTIDIKETDSISESRVFESFTGLTQI